MTQYIPKAALVAEIERLKKKNDAYNKPSHIADVCCKEFLLLIDTLEVREVDLEKELIEWHKEHFKKDGTFIGMSGFYLTNSSQIDIAKHFFELGLKAQKGE